jgi:hypothetical protein
MTTSHDGTTAATPDITTASIPSAANARCCMMAASCCTTESAIFMYSYPLFLAGIQESVFPEVAGFDFATPTFQKMYGR